MKKEFMKKLAEILDVLDLDDKAELSTFDSWDSLSVLSVISLADELWGVTVDGTLVRSATTPEELFKILQDRK